MNDFDGKLFIERLKEAGNTTQKKIAEAIGVEPSLVSQWKSGQSTPNARQIKELATVYGCSTDHLLGMDETTGSREPTLSEACGHLAGMGKFFELLPKMTEAHVETAGAFDEAVVTVPDTYHIELKPKIHPGAFKKIWDFVSMSSKLEATFGRESEEFEEICGMLLKKLKAELEAYDLFS